MSTTDIVRQFIVAEMMPPGTDGDFDDADSLIDSGIIDSMGVMKLITFLEDKFSIRIGAAELLPDNFESVAAITGLLQRLTS